MDGAVEEPKREAVCKFESDRSGLGAFFQVAFRGCHRLTCVTDENGPDDGLKCSREPPGIA